MLYSYKCRHCRRKFYVDVPITSRIEQGKHVNAKCPHCQSKDVKKLIDRPNVHFKGTGFTKGSVQ